MSAEPTLNETLSRLGWHTAERQNPAGQGKRVYDADGNDLGDLSAHEVWELLRDRGLVPEERSDA